MRVVSDMYTGMEFTYLEYEYEEVSIFWTTAFYLCCGVAALFSPVAAALFGIASYMIYVYLLPVCALLAAWIYHRHIIIYICLWDLHMECQRTSLGYCGTTMEPVVFGIWSLLILAIETMGDSLITIIPNFLPTDLLKNISTRVDYSSSNLDVPQADVSYHVDNHLLCGLASFPLLETLVQMDMKYYQGSVSRLRSALYIVFMFFYTHV